MDVEVNDYTSSLIFFKVLSLMIESFRFEDKSEYEYDIYLTFFACSITKTPGKASFYFFSTQKLVWLFLLKEVYPSPNGKN